MKSRATNGDGVATHRRAYAILLVLLAATAWAYRGNLALGFTGADALASVATARVNEPADIARQLWMPMTGGLAEINAAFWRPVTMLQFALLRGLFGWNPLGWQLWDLALHLVVVVLVFRLMRAVNRSDVEALVAAGIVALHPLGVEIVPVVARNNDSLAALLCVAAMIAIARDRFLWAVLFGLLSMGAKEPVVAVLLVLVLWAVALGKRRGALTLALGWGVGLVLYVLGRGALLDGWGGYDETGAVFYARNVGRILSTYTLELLFPGWSPQIEWRLSELGGRFVAAALLVATGLLATLAWRRGNRVSMLGFCIVFATFVLVAVFSTYSRRLLYLPTIGLAIGLVPLIGHRYLRWVLFAWMATLLPASPLVHSDDDWRRADEIRHALTDGVAAELRALPENATVSVLDLPIRVNHDPRRRRLWFRGLSVTNVMARYSLQAWIDDRLGREDIELRFFDRTEVMSTFDEPVVVVEDGAILVQRMPLERFWDRWVDLEWKVESDGDGIRLTRIDGEKDQWLLVVGAPRAVLVQVP